MIRLRHVFGAQTGKVVELDKPLVRCGRLPDNDLAFDPYADIDSSGRHAEILKEGDAWYVVDVGSRNGTMINGQRVQRQRVQNGDVIEFGKGGPRVQVELPTETPAQGRAAAELAASPEVAGAAPAGAGPRVVINTGGSKPPPAAAATVGPTAVAPQSGAPSEAAAGPGKATVAMMIASVVKGRGKSTEEIKAITADAVAKSSRRLKIALWLVTMLLLLAVGGGAVVLMFQRQDAATLQGDLRSSYERLEQMNRAGDAVRAQDTAERTALQARIGDLTKQLQEQARGPGSRIAQEARNAVYMLAALPPDGRELGFCSAFAVAPDLLATNAHCVLEMERMQREGTRFIALPNGGQGGRFGVTYMGRHPGFRPDAPDPTEDCGLIRIAGQATSVVRLAPPAELARLQPGDTIHVYGFPGNLMEARSPVATLTSGVIGRITSFAGLSAPFAQSLLLQHSAFTSPGTSGSPIFNNEGLVIGVNTGAFRRLARQTMIDPATGRRGDVLMTQDLSGYAFGVRSDLVQALLMGMQGQPPGTVGVQ